MWNMSELRRPARIAVTGGSGLLGRYLVRQLVDNGHEVLVLGRSTGAKPAVGVRYAVTDYSLSSLASLLAGVEQVFHLAALRGGSRLVSPYIENIEIAENVAIASRDSGVSVFFNASSISVYTSGRPSPVYLEGRDEAPGNGYGLSKLWAEAAIARAVSGACRVVHGRFGHLYGAFERNEYAINKFLASARVGELISVDQNAWDSRDFVFAKDAARAATLLVEESQFEGVVNVGSGAPSSLGEMAEHIADVYQSPFSLGHSVRPSSPSVLTQMDIARLTNLVDYVSTSPRVALVSIKESEEAGELL